MNGACFLGANGPMRWEDLTDGDRAVVEEVRQLLRDRKAAVEPCGCTPHRECDACEIAEDAKAKRREDV